MKKYYYLIILISLIALWPFFKTGYFESHDGQWMVIRFSAFHQTLADGQFPVRFVDRLNNNYGYPVLNFLYPLPFYLAEIPKVLGFGFVDSIKIIFAVSTIASSVFMFWALSQFFGKYASFTGAIVYLFVPYRFLDIYVRGSLGENLAFAFAPLILGSVFKIAKGKKLFFPLLSIFVAGLILSHNVMAVLFLPLFLLVILTTIKKRIPVVLAFLGLGILASAFFWLSALYDLQFVHLSQIKISNIEDYLVNVTKLIWPTWGYGPNPNATSGLSVQLGIVTISVFIGTVLLKLTTKYKNFLIDALLIVFVLIFVLLTKYSLSIWKLIPYLDIIQFPFRLLSLVVFISAIFSAFIVSLNRNKIVLAILLVLASILSTIIYTKPMSFVNKGDAYYSTNEDTTTVKDEYLPLWVSEKPNTRAVNKIEVASGDAKIYEREIKHSFYSADIKAQEESIIKVNSIYFPGWEVRENGRKVPISYQNKYGLITFQLSAGIHKVIINYARSPVHRLSEYISLLAFFVIGGYFYFLWQRKNS